MSDTTGNAEKPQLDLESFFLILKLVGLNPIWEQTRPTRKHPQILLKHRENKKIFDPLTAVYFELTGEFIFRCFLVPELISTAAEIGEGNRRLTENDVVELAYASDACTCGHKYDADLRNRLLVTLGFPPENTGKQQEQQDGNLLVDVSDKCMVSLSKGHSIKLNYEMDSKEPTVTVYQVAPDTDVDPHEKFVLSHLQELKTAGHHSVTEWSNRLGLSADGFILLLRAHAPQKK